MIDAGSASRRGFDVALAGALGLLGGAAAQEPARTRRVGLLSPSVTPRLDKEFRAALVARDGAPDIPIVMINAGDAFAHAYKSGGY